MFWLIRLGAYSLSTWVAWHFFQNWGVSDNLLFAGKILSLDTEHQMFFGVCAGLSNYTGLDVTIIRLLWTLAAFYRGLGIILYILAFLIMPPAV
ncbi:MAG: pspC [Firmicutes bacterium]|nr:pspC [Bacillota bacterium]